MTKPIHRWTLSELEVRRTFLKRSLSEPHVPSFRSQLEADLIIVEETIMKCIGEKSTEPIRQSKDRV
jgi:hypothetical protein